LTCVLDTDVVIAALDRADAHHARAALMLKAATKANETLLLSAINYAEALVRPAENRETLRTAVDAIAALGITVVSPSPAIAREAARLRHLKVSLADGFAIATTRAHHATLATFDQRVRKVLDPAGVELAPLLE
jgi:predicted nucleic acid-binding protein